MRFTLIPAILILCSVAGCTSFKTTSLFRKSGNEIVPQKTNAPLKGLPVKMKVPSHVNVVIYEQQLILAANDSERIELEREVKDAAQKVSDTTRSIAQISDQISKAKQEFDDIKLRYERLRDHEDNSQPHIANLLKELLEQQARKKNEKEVLEADAPRRLAKLENELKSQLAALATAKSNAVPAYKLVSFNPPQYIVESELQYTDKVFLVDFKRPAGGILDLTSAKMDDEQYFAQVKAKVEERTIEDISGVLGKLNPKAPKPPTAKPTSADTPEAEANSEVHFQKSVVAMKRFDVSQFGWEQQMTEFVNGKLQGNSEVMLDSTQIH